MNNKCEWCKQELKKEQVIFCSKECHQKWKYNEILNELRLEGEFEEE